MVFIIIWNVITEIITRRADAPVVTPDFGKLLVCLAIDTIGSSSELLPILGEVTDIAWAPLAALALRSLYGSNVVFALEFTEEILPFTDIIPLATLCWVVETFFGDSDVAKALQVGRYGKDSGTVIDISSQKSGDDEIEQIKGYLPDRSNSK